MRRPTVVIISSVIVLLGLVVLWRSVQPTPPTVPDYIASPKGGWLFHRDGESCRPSIPGGASQATLMGHLGAAQIVGPEDGFNRQASYARYDAASGATVYATKISKWGPSALYLVVDECYYAYAPEG